MTETRRISGLDGIRAVAITLVIGLHTWQNNPNPILHMLFAGQDGVGLFFILSGFLITALLLREYDRKGSIAIGHFYFRRAVRIVPPLLVYLLVVAIIEDVLHDPMPLPVFASVLFFFHNMSNAGGWMLEHTWSLAVEEQFYVLWPIVFVLALSISRRTAVLTTATLIAIAPAMRIGGHALNWKWLHLHEAILLPTRMDALLCGCLMALLVGGGALRAGV